MTETKARAIMTKARTRLVTGYPFFGNVAMKLKLIEDSSVKTMATDGKVIKFNPSWVEELPLAEVVGVFAHEIMHVTNGHHLRQNHGQERDSTSWNIACDYAINSILLKEGFILPEGGLFDDENKFGNGSAEIIYKTVHEEIEEWKEEQEANSQSEQESSESEDSSEGNGSAQSSEDSSEEGEGGSGTGSNSQEDEDEEDSQGSGTGSSIDDFIEEKYGKLLGEVEQQKTEEGKELSEAETERKLEELRVDVVQSEMRAKARGTGGSDFAKDLKGYVKDKVDWREKLLNLAQDSIASDFTWNYPNRRYIAEGMYLPSQDKDQLNTLVIGVDQSSSVRDVYVSLFEGCMKSIVEQVGFEKIYICYFTGILNEVVELDAGDNFKMKPSRYYGGTEFRVVTDWIEQEGITPSCLLMLTDGECHVPIEPNYPVGWCLIPNYDNWCIKYCGLDRYGEIIELEM
tara:strand:+ start:544 stop:1917 length:1374 start_codon:yes stop_codon:yes gene_type:complete